jgi:hypothetical protein
MASKDILFHACSCAIIAGAVIGANFSVYKVMEQNPKYTTADFIIGAMGGASLGAMVAAISPTIAASTIVCLPSYVIKNMQSNE